MAARAILKEWSQREREINLRAEQFKDQEEIKQSRERNGVCEQPERRREKMKKICERLRDYDWKEELERMYKIL